MMGIHKNGGVPDQMVILENTQPNSPSYKKMREQLLKYKPVENKHGTLLMTGKVTIETLQQLDTMQFKDMGLYITGLIAMQWGIPKNSIPYIVGGTNTKEDTGGGSEKAYWRVIEFLQDIFAETMNLQLWIPYFGVRIVFDNTYVQQDVQVETAKQLKFNNVKLIDDMARAKGKQIKFDRYIDFIGLDGHDFEDYDATEDVNVNGTLNQQLSQDEVNDSDSDKNKKDKKKQEQDDLKKGGMRDDSGVGKEWTPNADLELKQLKNIEIKESNVQDVPIDTFIKLYKEDKVIRSGKPPRMFLKQNDTMASYKFMSDDFVYRTVINKEELSDVARMELSVNLYIL